MTTENGSNIDFDQICRQIDELEDSANSLLIKNGFTAEILEVYIDLCQQKEKHLNGSIGSGLDDNLYTLSDIYYTLGYKKEAYVSVAHGAQVQLSNIIGKVKKGLQSLYILNMLKKASKIANEIGDVGESIKYMQDVVNYSMEWYGDEDVDYAINLIDLAELYVSNSQNTTAEEILHTALSVVRLSFGNKSNKHASRIHKLLCLDSLQHIEEDTSDAVLDNSETVEENLAALSITENHNDDYMKPVININNENDDNLWSLAFDGNNEVGLIGDINEAVEINERSRLAVEDMNSFDHQVDPVEGMSLFDHHIDPRLLRLKHVDNFSIMSDLTNTDDLGASFLIRNNSVSFIDAGRSFLMNDESTTPKSQLYHYQTITRENLLLGNGNISNICNISNISNNIDISNNINSQRITLDTNAEQVELLPDFIYGNLNRDVFSGYTESVAANDEYLTLTVSYLDLPQEVKAVYLNRKNESTYLAYVGKEITLDLFPSNSSYQPIWQHMSRVCMSYRVRRAVLEDDISNTNDEIKRYNTLIEVCEQKKLYQFNRLVSLESEMDYMMIDDPSSPKSQFNSLLALKQGYLVVTNLLNKEYKRLQYSHPPATAKQSKKPMGLTENTADGKNSSDAAVEVQVTAMELAEMASIECTSINGSDDRNITTGIIETVWHLLQQWRIVKSIEAFSRLGPERYPIKSGTISNFKNTTADDVTPRSANSNNTGSTGSKSKKSSKSKQTKGVNTNSDAVDEVNKQVQEQVQEQVQLHTIDSNAVIDDIKPTDNEDRNVTRRDDATAFTDDKIEEAMPVVPKAKVLSSLLPGERIAEWGDICKSINIRPTPVLKTVIAALLTHINTDTSIYPNVVDNTHLSDLCVGMNELMPNENNSTFISDALVKVLDRLADAIQSYMTDPLRNFVQWQQLLDKSRKERIRRVGGKLTMADQGEVETDQYGVQRVIAHADTVIDTDILHGVSQRVNIHLVIPEAHKKIELAKRKSDALHGELCCLIQYGYMTAVPFTQRVWRGMLARLRRYRMRKDVVYYAMHAASGTIAAWYLSIHGKRMHAKKKDSLFDKAYDGAVVFLQACCRGLIKRYKYNRYINRKRADSRWFAITKFQSFIRGFNARRYVRRILHQGSQEKEKKLQEWGIINIQKVARGYIARKTIIKSMHIRSSISPDLLRLAERYLYNGDMWGFLKQIDSSIGRLKQDLLDERQIEDDMAVTFVEKVLKARQSEFDGSWDRFARTAMTNTTGRKGFSHSSTATATADTDSLTAIGQGVDKSKLWNKLNTSEVNTSSSSSSLTSPVKVAAPGVGSIDAAVSGPLLRRAVSATVQKGVMIEVERQKQAEKKSVKLMNDIKDAYGNDITVKHKKIPKHLKEINKKLGIGKDSKLTKKNVKRLSNTAAASSSPTPRANNDNNSVGTADSSDANATVNTAMNKSHTTNNSSYSQSQAIKTGPGGGKIDASHTDWFTPSATITKPFSSSSSSRNNTATATTTATTASMKLLSTKGNFSYPGESILIDIPKGINDTIDSLMKAAAIRSYVPDFCDGLTSKQAYELYLKMPMGLAKVKYETEAWKWASVPINQLRLMGIVNIMDAMPMSKMKMFLRSAATPPALRDVCIDFILMLQKMGNIATGETHKETEERSISLLKEDQGTIRQVLKVMESQRPLPVQVESPPVTPAAVREENKQYEISVEAMNDPTLPGRLLLSMVEEGSWQNLNASIEDLFCHAAFLVVPHITHTHLPDGSVSAEESAMGHVAFKLHTKQLQVLKTVEERKEALRTRFRAALIMATPYCLRLQADGVQLIRDLTKVNLPDYNLPSKYESQVESLISMAISMNQNAKVVPVVRDHVATNKEVFVVPMTYNPKYQRSPFDPYGRPPRLGPLKSLIKNKSKSQLDRAKKEKAMYDETSAGSLFPSNLLDTINANTAYTTSSNSATATATATAAGDDCDIDDSINAGGSLLSTSMPDLYKFQPSDTSIGAKVTGTSDSIDLGDLVINGQRQRKDKPLTKKQKDKQVAEARRILYSRDFEAIVRSGFQRPFICNHPGCGQQFSRAYTMKIHSKSHYVFARYHEYKKEPQLFLDEDVKSFYIEKEMRDKATWSLPPLVQMELDLLATPAVSRMSSRQSGTDSFNTTAFRHGVSRGSSRGASRGGSRGGSRSSLDSRSSTPVLAYSSSASVAGSRLGSPIIRNALSSRGGSASASISRASTAVMTRELSTAGSTRSGTANRVKFQDYNNSNSSSISSSQFVDQQFSSLFSGEAEDDNDDNAPSNTIDIVRFGTQLSDEKMSYNNYDDDEDDENDTFINDNTVTTNPFEEHIINYNEE